MASSASTYPILEQNKETQKAEKWFICKGDLEEEEERRAEELSIEILDQVLTIIHA